MTSSEEALSVIDQSVSLRTSRFVQRWFRAMWRGRRGVSLVVAISSLFVAFLVIAAIYPSLLAAADPLATDPRHAFAAPSAAHLLGTDENGRDVWARLIYGARPSLLLGLVAAAITATIGVLLGLAAGLSPRLIDNIIMRFTDVLQSFPELLLVLLVISFWGTGTITLLIGLGIAGVPTRARQVRAQVLVVRRAPFVEAAHTLGIPAWLVILRHVVPNSVRPVLVLLPLEVGWKIATVATLSFLGVGSPPPAPLWGAMLAIDRDYILNAWWLTAIPAAVITLTVLAINTLGRDLTRRSEGRT
jgi:peptide/nickel transport system permease protein